MFLKLLGIYLDGHMFSCLVNDLLTLESELIFPCQEVASSLLPFPAVFLGSQISFDLGYLSLGVGIGTVLQYGHVAIYLSYGGQ